MKKQKKQFLIVCILLVILLAVFFCLKAYNSHQKEQEAEKEKQETIVATDLSKEEIKGFSYQKDGEELAFEKEKDTWYYKPDHSIPISSAMIETMLGAVERITAEQQITAVEDIGQYGFDEPKNVITLEIGKETLTISIGMYNEITSQYYLMVSGSDNVYLVDDAVFTAFQKSVEELTEEKSEDGITPEEGGQKEENEEGANGKDTMDSDNAGGEILE